jgi:hypothetical protein
MSHLNKELLTASGNIKIKGRLEAFLYTLMRDELPVGAVQRLVDDACICDEECEYSNGYLAQYAYWLANKLCAIDVIREEHHE